MFLNFKERWERQGEPQKGGKLIRLQDTSVEIEAVPSMDPESSWNVQLFRSITEDSAQFDEKRFEDKTYHMNTKRGRAIFQ